jgi:DNA-binding NtrC family response regulator
MANKKILIIEDEVLIARSLSFEFQEIELKVIGIAANYEHAIQSISDQIPHIVISDINLKSDKDGLDAAKWINDFDKSIRIIFITGYGYDTVAERIKEVNFDLMLEKPMEAFDIVEIIKNGILHDFYEDSSSPSRTRLHGSLRQWS